MDPHDEYNHVYETLFGPVRYNDRLQTESRIGERKIEYDGLAFRALDFARILKSGRSLSFIGSAAVAVLIVTALNNKSAVAEEIHGVMPIGREAPAAVVERFNKQEELKAKNAEKADKKKNDQKPKRKRNFQRRRMVSV